MREGKVFTILAPLLTKESRLKDVYANPIGHDIVYKILLQMGKSERWVTNPFVANLKLKTVAKLAKGLLGEGFIDTLLQLLNSNRTLLPRSAATSTRAWWKEAIVYQIYPRSFMDGNGDGIGDLEGIIAKLDYLQELGVDVLWLSPIYDSPNDDNGYDIRDYEQIMAEFGTMADFDRMLAAIHARGMKLIMDLVVNHTSDEHRWFVDSRSNPDSLYKDYYLWQKADGDGPPNNWTSFFSGSAWNYYEERGEWALHLFSKKQMDLNWDNPTLRQDVYAMIRRWLDKGIDGFRLDVINYISKQDGMPQGNESIGKLMGYYGIEHYFFGPKLHEYLQEMRQETFAHYDVMTVGETPGVGREMSRLLTAESREELDMVFSFDHLETPGKVRFDDYRYDLNYAKQYYTDWMLHYGNESWMSLFFENHDNPRMISKVNPDPRYRDVLGKLLAMMQLTLKGTPFIYQGQELGMVNADFTSIEQFRDVESVNLYRELVPTLGAEAALAKVISGSRDHARTPMQWSGDAYAGFSTVEPWLYVGADDERYYVEQALVDQTSVVHFYKRLIALRKADDVLVYGDFIPVAQRKKDLFCYYRTLGGTKYYIEMNVADRERKRAHAVAQYERLLSNYDCEAMSLRPYEATLYRCM